MTGPSDTVGTLPWFAPSAASLAVLARPKADWWDAVRGDPAAVLLLLRCGPDSVPLLHDPSPLRFAASMLDHAPAGTLDGDDPALHPLFDACRSLAQLTAALARRTGQADPMRAWCAGLLAPLGWLAVAAWSRERFDQCWTDPGLSREPLRTQERHWGTSAAVLSSRLARAWGLPAWLVGVLANVELPAVEVGRLGVDAPLLAMVRVALHLLRQGGTELGLLSRQDAPARDAALLGIELETLDAGELAAGEPTVSLGRWESPYDAPLLRDLLAVAIDLNTTRGGAAHASLQQEADDLRAVLRDQLLGESERLRDAKLAALAEFAAGAGHEINNPLAVISGQAQYVLGHAADWLTADDEGHTARALQTIIGQTRRIHAILRDLMQFSRPAPARPGWHDLPTLLGEVAASLGEAAAGRKVQVEVAARPEQLAVWMDADQVRSALTCLLRNAIEAAGPEGYARLALDATAASESIEVFIEDSGPGPAPDQRSHLFDPFYSGRSAGRGKGLGLPVAWRLARQQGGDVRLDPPRPGQPTRFVLVLPRGDAPDGRRAA